MRHITPPSRRAHEWAPIVFAAAAVSAVAVAAFLAVFVGIDENTAPVIRVVLFGLAPSFAVLTAAAIAVARGKDPASIRVPAALAIAAIALSTATQMAWDANMLAEQAAPSAGWWFAVGAGVAVTASSIFSLVWMGVNVERRTAGLMIAFVVCSVVGGVVLMIAWAIWVTPVSLAAGAFVAAALARRPRQTHRHGADLSAPS